MTYLEKLKKIETYKSSSKNAERICSELTYLDSLSDLRDGLYNAEIERAADLLLEFIEKDGAITKTAVLAVEDALMELKSAAKSLKELFISHAHIDMNWQWGYNETANITVDTFRTILALMREYPEYTFAQSQASTYEIIEKYRPDMLDEIRQRIKEGRWEVTAAEWVEPDKNMPSGESMTRQLLEAKKYLTKLLDLEEGQICIDFVPDTFGHAVTVPEILCDAGIKYMYHCRGLEGPCFYKYRAPSGKEVLAYKEFRWYNSAITPLSFEVVPTFCKQEKLDTYLCVYGVGDHGGGPSRRDIERIIEYSKWPLTPDIRFGTYREFFEIAEKQISDLPVIDRELNFLFSGCYTTQSRIKMANRISEARIFETESIAASATALAGAPAMQDRFDEPWRNILFNHFHDILPGSGTVETREHAMGKFQDTMAALQTRATASMNAIADKIDTSHIDLELDSAAETTSEGSGVGFGSDDRKSRFILTSAERGRGPVRIFHVFNPTGYDRDEVTEIIAWDYYDDSSRVGFFDANGHSLEFSVVDDPRGRKKSGYWGHSFDRYLVKVKVPAMGYTTVIMKQVTVNGHLKPYIFTAEHTDHEDVNSAPIVLENSKMKAVFNKTDGHLVHLFDKVGGKVLVDTPSCFFRYIEENPLYNYIAWRVGPYAKTVDLNSECSTRFLGTVYRATYQRLTYAFEFGTTEFKVEITLRKDSPILDFNITVDWKIDSVVNKMIPQLAFAVPVSYKVDASLCEIPFGRIKRECTSFDVPCLGAMGILGEQGRIVALLSDTKYGFRCCDGMGQITLLRNAYNPDPYSDRGVHRIRLGVAICEPDEIDRLSNVMNHPMPFISATGHSGTLPLEASVMSIEGNVRLSALKNAEDESGTVVRLYDVSGQDQSVTLTMCAPVKAAYLTNIHETLENKLECDGNKVVVTVPKYSVVTVKVAF